MAKKNKTSRNPDPFQNYVLECPDAIWPDNGKDITDSMKRTSPQETERYRLMSVQHTGSDIMPSVLYKGRMIPAGRLGTRTLAFA